MAFNVDPAEIEKARIYYITHYDTLKQVAERFDLPVNVLKYNAGLQGWKKQQEEARKKVSEKVEDSMIENRAKEMEEQLVGVAEASGLLCERLLRIVQDENVFRKKQVVLRRTDGSTYAADVLTEEIDARGAKDIALAIKEAANTVRSLYGLPTVIEKSQMMVSEKRLALDEKKFEESKEDNAPAEVVVRFENAKPEAVDGEAGNAEDTAAQ